ncbi:hypothetical protein ZHAS_00010503 [Anopheles sinensis]|uniref:Uncharacterized protein n=1 Tax=Anopheles sinensis TaxID=74873 RepID=A0A084VXQ6_ANOSI|nr:hypothetical protein ZHAS_00010503 [Anopheles sinensis]
MAVGDAIVVVRRQTCFPYAIHELVVLILLLLHTTGVSCEDVTLLLTLVARSKDETKVQIHSIILGDSSANGLSRFAAVCQH